MLNYIYLNALLKGPILGWSWSHQPYSLALKTLQMEDNSGTCTNTTGLINVYVFYHRPGLNFFFFFVCTYPICRAGSGSQFMGLSWEGWTEKLLFPAPAAAEFHRSWMALKLCPSVSSWKACGILKVNSRIDTNVIN